MAAYVDEQVWKCSKHPSNSKTGICPACLRERLAGLCPCCANVRPCPCLASTSSSSFGSSFHRSKSVAIPFMRSRHGGEQPHSPLKKTSSFLSILRRGSKQRNEGSVESFEGRDRIDDFARMVTRSRSVTAGGCRRANADSSPAKGRFWHFPSPMTVFRSPRAPKVGVQD